jgi:hypothetical protein
MFLSSSNHFLAFLFSKEMITGANPNSSLLLNGKAMMPSFFQNMKGPEASRVLQPAIFEDG